MASARAGIVYQPHGQTTIEHLPLEEVSVRAWVVDVSSRILLTQTFYNPSDKPTGRAKYVFPLPASAAVCAFELELEDGSVIIGEVKEKEEAVLTFTGAVNQGQTAALVEWVTDDIFTISVGCIPATTKVMAHLTFVMDLLNEGLQDHVRLQLPMYISERYGAPPTAMQSTSAADSRTRVDIRVDFQMSDEIIDLCSPTHPIRLRHYRARSGKRSRRRMSAVWNSSEFLASDFVITIYAEGLDQPRCFAEVLDEGSGASSTVAMQLTLVPKLLTSKVPSQEYIFIIDRSGSMDGAPIETAKRTLTMLLRLLPSSGTTFNIFSFGNHNTSLWPSSRGLDQVSLTEATSHVASMSANYGGTEIPAALQSAFDSRGLDRPAAIFLITDGRIHQNDELNSQVVILNAIQNSPLGVPVRLFVLGIGAAVSSAVCTSIARKGNGEYLFALLAEDISGKCARLLNAGRSKNIERIDIEWGHGVSGLPIGMSSSTTLDLPASVPALAPPPPVQQAPHSLTRIFSGIRFTVFAIISSGSVPSSVKLITKQEDADPQELILEVLRVKPFPGTYEHSSIPIVHTLAARKLIMELDDGNGPLPTPVSGVALLVSEDDLRKAGIIRLGLAYQLVSKHTSFVAVRRGSEQLRNRRRRSGGMWARSRLRRTGEDTDGHSPTEAPTFLDGLINGVSSVISSIIGFLGYSTSTSTFHAPSKHQLFPGAYNSSDSGTSERGRRSKPTSDPSPNHGSLSHYSTDTFSTLSSLEGSSCSSCWTDSRLSLPSEVDGRAPSPDFRVQDATIPNPVISRKQNNISQAVYQLSLEMNIDGSFTRSPLLTQLVGDMVLDKANELGIERNVWATVVATAYMRKHLQDEPDLLELLSEKAKEFMEASGYGARRFDSMVRSAAALLNSITA